jgi:hypothetical protein
VLVAQSCDMNDELAQLVALTSHGNVYLTDRRSGSPPDLLGSNSAFVCVRSVTFVDENNSVKASTPAQWLSGLRRAETKRLRLADLGPRGELPAHIAESFSGGVHRGIQVDHEGSEELWEPQWRFGRGQLWNVRYTRALLDRSLVTPGPSLELCQEALLTGIEEARRFAEKTDNRYWAEYFSRALEAIRALDDSDFSDLLPETGYSPIARRIFETARRACVFGGMGSWNDLWFPDDHLQARYEAVTASLYVAVIRAIVATTNSFGEESSQT